MAIKFRYDSKDDVPEAHAALYTEVDGGWELTGVTGIKTTKDTERLQTSLNKERTAHKATKAKLKDWDGLEHDEVVEQLDRIHELEAAAGGKLDAAKIDELASKKADAKVKTATAPLERQITKLTESNTELTTANTSLTADAGTRSMQDALRPLMAKAGVRPEHHDDVFLYANRDIERSEEGAFTAKSSSKVAPGADLEGWLSDMVESRPGWLPASAGAGAKPGTAGGGSAKSAFTHDGWNMGAQGAYLTEHGQEKAEAMALAAGSPKLGVKPPPPTVKVT